MAATSQDPDEIISGINVTPLVDIVLVILIIFIVTASFVFRNTIDMELPKAATGEQSVSGLLNLAIDSDGQLFINGRKGALDDIPQAVRDASQKLTDQGRDPKVNAFVSADIRTRYGAFAGVVDRLRLEGVTQIALDTQPLDLGQVAP
jgi:biopolymer transport protein ExbD